MTPSGQSTGTVTALGSLFAAEEALKASKRVNDAIAARRGELDRVKSFAADNSALTHLVRQLPDEISHDIMVPFGSAAFFPGQLVHTNEFLVLLGDGYFAERTSKQLVEILKRRDRSLDSQMEALKASLLDLEAEAKFFDSTAAEAKEGIVEIREEFMEDTQTQQEDIVEIREEYTEEPQNDSDSEDEHARIMARLDELEKEELEAESDHGSDQDEDSQSRPEAESASGGNKDEDFEADGASGSEEDKDIVHGDEADDDGEDSDAGFGSNAPKNYDSDYTGITSEKLKSIEPAQKSGSRELPQSTAKPVDGGSHQHLAHYPSISDPNSIFLDGGSHSDGSIKNNMVSSRPTYKPPLPADSKKKLHNSSELKLEDSTNNSASASGRSGVSERKAFTGSVIEHSYCLCLSSNPASKSTSSSDKPSKPVSRFKMMKGNH